MVCGSVMIVTGYGLDTRDSIPGSQVLSCLSISEGQISGAHPFSYLMYSWNSFRGIKAVKYEPSQSPCVGLRVVLNGAQGHFHLALILQK
jgi:hypothetical protein